MNLSQLFIFVVSYISQSSLFSLYSAFSKCVLNATSFPVSCSSTTQMYLFRRVMQFRNADQFAVPAGSMPKNWSPYTKSNCCSLMEFHQVGRKYLTWGPSSLVAVTRKDRFSEERNIRARCTHWLLGCKQEKLQEPLWRSFHRNLLCLPNGL